MNILRFLILCIGLLLITGCRNRNGRLESDFQSVTFAANPICYDLSQTLSTTVPDREALSKMKISEYRIGNFYGAIRYAQRKFEDVQEVIRGKMFVEEAAAIALYTERTYTDVNTALWARDCEKLKLFNEVIASGLNKAPAIFGNVYRGGQIRDSEVEDFQVGHEIISPAFLSASISRDVAKKFIRNAFFEIETEGLGLISWISVNGGEVSSTPEKEVLIPPGSRFIVQSVEDVDGHKVVKMKHVNHSLGVLRFPAQAPSSILKLSSTFKSRGEFKSVGQKMFSKFKPGTYSGENCQLVVSGEADFPKFTIKNPDGETTIDTVELSKLEKFEGNLVTDWDYPLLLANLTMYNGRELLQVVMRLQNETDWVGIDMGFLKRTECRFTPSIKI